ncbi:MAG: hypothetical protein ACM3PP_10045 [Candidatus Saccharibacteria bacterium]
MKKVAALLLLVLLVVSSIGLVGCGKAKDSSKPADKSSSVTSSSATSNIDPEIAALMEVGKKSAEKGVYYESVMKAKGMNTTTKMWQQGKKMRSESEFAGMKVAMIVNPDKNLFVSYMPGLGTATSLDSNAKKAMTQNTADQWTTQGSNVYKITGSETMNGVSCKVMEGKPAGMDNVKVWIAADTGMPIKMEAEVYGDPMTMDFKNYKFGPQPDSVFELPAGVKVTEMPKK